MGTWPGLETAVPVTLGRINVGFIKTIGYVTGIDNDFN